MTRSLAVSSPRSRGFLARLIALLLMATLGAEAVIQVILRLLPSSRP